MRRALADDRLVTLTGTGGVGKTRLAIQVAGQLGADFAAGVWYVDLAPIADPGLVPVAVAGALGLRGPAGPLDDRHAHPVRGGPPDVGTAR